MVYPPLPNCRFSWGSDPSPPIFNETADLLVEGVPRFLLHLDIFCPFTIFASLPALASLRFRDSAERTKGPNRDSTDEAHAPSAPAAAGADAIRLTSTRL